MTEHEKTTQIAKLVETGVVKPASSLSPLKPIDTQITNELIKSMYGNDLTDSEFQVFFAVCQKTGLDAIARQIFAIKRGGKLTIQTSIDGYRLIADRTRLMKGYTSTEWCGTDGVWKDVWLEKTPPAAARVGVIRKGFDQPVVETANFAGYSQNTPPWQKMPEHMLAKCAEAKALRKAFPQELSGLYTDDEVGQETVLEVKVNQTPSLTNKLMSLLKAKGLLSASKEENLIKFCEITGYDTIKDLNQEQILDALASVENYNPDEQEAA